MKFSFTSLPKELRNLILDYTITVDNDFPIMRANRECRNRLLKHGAIPKKIHGFNFSVDTLYNDDGYEDRDIEIICFAHEWSPVFQFSEDKVMVKYDHAVRTSRFNLSLSRILTLFASPPQTVEFFCGSNGAPLKIFLQQCLKWRALEAVGIQGVPNHIVFILQQLHGLQYEHLRIQTDHREPLHIEKPGLVYPGCSLLNFVCNKLNGLQNLRIPDTIRTLFISIISTSIPTLIDFLKHYLSEERFHKQSLLICCHKIDHYARFYVNKDYDELMEKLKGMDSLVELSDDSPFSSLIDEHFIQYFSPQKTRSTREDLPIHYSMLKPLSIPKRNYWMKEASATHRFLLFSAVVCYDGSQSVNVAVKKLNDLGSW